MKRIIFLTVPVSISLARLAQNARVGSALESLVITDRSIG
jgi:hypothetical protein